MPTSRPIRRGEWLTDIRTGFRIGANKQASGRENPDGYVLQSDFGLESLGGDEYWRTMCERVFGISDDRDMEIALANRTAPGLYVREGDDTSNWEEYRQVLARRVAEATGASVTAAASVGFREDLWRRICRHFIGEDNTASGAKLTDVGSVSTSRLTFEAGPRSGDFWFTELGPDRTPDLNQITTRFAVYSELKPLYALFESCADQHITVGDMRPRPPLVPTDPLDWVVRSDVWPGLPRLSLAKLDQLAENEVTRRLVAQTAREAIQRPMGRIVDVRFDDGLAEYVRPLGRVSDNHTSNAPRAQPRTIEVTLNPATPAQTVRLTEEMRRITERVVREEIAAAQPQQQQQPQPKLEPTRFGLLEVDLPAQPSKTTPKTDTDLAELQATFRIEREQRRAQAAAHAQKGRFDLIECDLPAEATKKVMTSEPPVEPKAKPMPKPAPVTQIADLTKARDVVELASMVAHIEAEVATALWRRETN